MESEYPNSSRRSEKLLQKSGGDQSMMIDGSRSLPPHIQSQINSGKPNLLYNGQLLDCSKEELILFDKFIRCKQEDKPKDTLAWLSLKRQQFQNYVNLPGRQQRSNHSTSIDIEKIHHNQAMRRYYECTIQRQVGQGTALVVRIRMSEPAKCNIVVYDAQGSVLKYYPNSLVIKKREKIIKIAEEYIHHPLLILDYAFQETQQQFFHSLYRKPRLILYHILHPAPKQLELCLAELAGLKAIDKIDFESMSQAISVYSAQKDLKQQGYQELIHLKDKFIQGLQQEESFLQAFRGNRPEQDRNLDYDLLGLHLWKCSNARAIDIIHKIIKLYKMKEETIIEQSSVPLPAANDLHVPYKMKKQQNCVLCLSKFPVIKSKRTYFVCKVCSAEKEKPFYLCKKCFGEYHLNPDIHIYKKNEKKTRRILKENRKKERQSEIDKVQSNPKQEIEESSTQARKRQSLNLFSRLEKMTEEVFERIDELLEEEGQDNIRPCQFYLSMMMNNNIRFIEMLEAKKRADLQSDPSA